MYFKKVVKKLKEFNPEDFVIVSGRAGRKFTEGVIEKLKKYSSDVRLGDLEISNFPGGEIKVKNDENLRGKSVHLFQCFRQQNDMEINNDLMELLVILDMLKISGATMVTVYLPYLAYQRQEKKTQGREPISAKLIFDIIYAAAGRHFEKLVTADMHTAAAAGFADDAVDNLTAWPLFALYIRKILGLSPNDYAIITPDFGGAPRARCFAEALGSRVAIAEKRRGISGDAIVYYLIGEEEVYGKIAIIIDDIIATAISLVKVQQLLTSKGAKAVYAFATHGLFNIKNDLAAEARLYDAEIKVVITDTIPEKHPGYFLSCHEWLKGVLSMTGYFADALYCNVTTTSLSELMKLNEYGAINSDGIDIEKNLIFVTK